MPAQAQLYSYIAPSTESFLKDEGELWAFVSDTPGVRHYYDVLPGSGTSVTGHFIKVPKMIATGLKPDGTEVKAADFGYPLPPTDGSWQRDPRSVAPLGIDGPQWVLEYWSDINNVFQFVRIEDIAYDKRPGMGNVVYIVDSGRGRAATQSLDTPNFRSTNGRVWKMVLDPKNPTIVTSMTVFVEGDDNPVKTYDEVHQPDNIETVSTGILLTEDPGSSQQFAITDTSPAATTASLVPNCRTTPPASHLWVSEAEMTTRPTGNPMRAATSPACSGLSAKRLSTTGISYAVRIAFAAGPDSICGRPAAVTGSMIARTLSTQGVNLELRAGGASLSAAWLS